MPETTFSESRDGEGIAVVKVNKDNESVEIPGFANEYTITLPNSADSDKAVVIVENDFSGEEIRIILDPNKKNLNLDVELDFQDQDKDLEFNTKEEALSIEAEILIEDVQIKLEPLPDSANRLVSFSGGGWNSHSTLAGLISGAIEASEGDLNTIFDNIDSISANSGGTWFLSQLAYSPSFSSSLENEGSRNNYNTSGYNGQVRQAFNSLSQNAGQETIKTLSDALGINLDKIISKDKQEFLSYVSGLAINALEVNKVNWRSFVDQFVYGYGDLQNLASVNLDSPRQTWAQAKDLIFATGITSYPSVIQNQGGLTQNKLFTAAKPNPLPSWWDQAQRKPSVLPLLIVSDANPNGGPISAYGEFPFGNVDLSFSSNELFGPSPKKASVASRLSSGLSIVDTTAASSSAVAALSSPDVFGSNALTEPFRNAAASYLRELAPLASFNNNTLSAPKESLALSSKTNLDDISNQSLARFADGGYVDNTSVASGLRQLQTSGGLAKPFEITLFMNSSIDPITYLPIPSGNSEQPTYKVQPDIAKLFGFDANGQRATDGVIEFEALPLKPSVTSPWIFKTDTSDSTANQSWSYSADGGSFTSQYFKVSVTTVDNEILGIRGGQSGVLHIFSTNNSQSFAAPVTPNILNEYDQNFSFGRDAISSGGWTYLAQALGTSTQA